VRLPATARVKAVTMTVPLITGENTEPQSDREGDRKLVVGWFTALATAFLYQAITSKEVSFSTLIFVIDRSLLIDVLELVEGGRSYESYWPDCSRRRRWQR